MKVSGLIRKSSLTFSISVILLIAVFFIGYYFYYIPTNRDELHKNGFLILQNIESGILEKNNDLQILYKNLFEESSDKNKDFQNLLVKNNVAGNAVSISRSSTKTIGVDTTYDFLVYNNANGELEPMVIKQKNFAYLFQNKKASQVLLPAEWILQSLLKSQRTELFESYLLVSRKNGIIYKDPQLGMASRVPIDSLFPQRESMFAGIKDISIENVNYKMFSYPFHFGNDDVILCGFINLKTYNAKLHAIPVSFIYPIVIAFLLLIIFLPIIKFYLIGKDETIKFSDIILGTLSFIVGSALITLILINVLILWSADERSKSNLDLLSAQIKVSFTNDILKAYRQLDSLDSLISVSKDSVLHEIKDTTINISDKVISYFQSHKSNPTLDYNFDRIFWIDSTGKQKIKGQLGSEAPLFTNVSSRRYFKIFKTNKAYMVPDYPDSLFGLEPVNSWADGEFTIIISKESRLKKGYIVAVATQMPSIMQTILPPGFGFCIIDDSGKVQLHSEMDRNLRENILEKMSPARPVIEAIRSRQASYFNKIRFYGKTNAVDIAPISKLPFFLVTFYDKGYIVPVAMRIFTFALLFCIFSFIISILIYILALRRPFYKNPLLYSPLEFLKWVIPKKQSSKFYVLATRFITAYILMLLLFLALSGYLNISNYIVLVLVLLIPVNLISCLFVISYATIKQNSNEHCKKEHKERALKGIAFQLLSSLMVYLYSLYSTYPIQWQFLIFQGMFNIAMWVFYFSSEDFLNLLSKSKRRYLPLYTQLATAIIICLSVLPAGLYTWYAHNQEITQSVKKGQLYLAESLQKREPSFIKFAQSHQELQLPAAYYDKLQFHSGIYKIYKDSFTKNNTFPLSRLKDSYEQFYFSIANDIGNNYYDPLLLPALKDDTSDSSWHWSRFYTMLFFKYIIPNNTIGNRYNNASSKSMNIISVFPARYVFVSLSLKGLALLFFILFLMRGLYILLKSVSDRIFLRKYIDTLESKTPPDDNGIKNLLEEFNTTNVKTYPGLNDDVKKLEEEYKYYIPAKTNKQINIQEKDMIEFLKRIKVFYDFIWRKCTEKERYLLLDFAQDSLVNFKNTAAIYSLVEKGLFIIHDDEMKIFCPSFRAYVYDKKDSSEIYQMQKEFQKNSTWQSFRIPLLIIFIGVALFIFFTQEEAFQKITALVAGVGSVLSLLLKFLTDNSSVGITKK